MQKLLMLIAGLGLVAGLTGCNSTDALTPQVDVGGGTLISSPVTQSDLDSMAEQQPVVPQQTTAFSTPAGIQTPGQSSLGRADPTYEDPAGSLEAQASRIRQGAVPPQERQLSRTARPAPESQPSETAEQVQDQTEQPQRLAAAPTTSTTAARGTIRFLPIIGAPVEAVTPLSKQLGTEARSRGLTIKGAADPNSQHILKGYFSVLKEDDKTVVVYVWDVLDGSGNRLHRIQGQDAVAATAADPWSVVPPATMQGIATRTIDAYLDWRQGQPG